ncbi:MAG: hypothetical protein QXK49_03650 [Candidatus Aenigmatarchaeota archaeon]
MNKIFNSKYRIEIEKYIFENIADKSFEEISVELSNKYDLIITPEDVEDYYRKVIVQGKALITQVANASKDVTELDFNLDKDLSNVVARFSYDVLSKEFNLIYDRIEELYKYAKNDPQNSSYDKRIIAYLERANQLRNFILKDAFEDLKRSVIADVGKRIIISAFSTFLHYIPDEYKNEAKDKFMNAIKKIIQNNLKEPEEIKKIREEYGQTTEKE